MSPGSPSAVRHAPRHAAAPAADPAQRLEVFRGDRQGPSAGRRRGMVAVLCVAALVASLVVVVVGQAMLTQGQVRLSAVEARLGAAQVQHRQKMLRVAQLETPARIVSVATSAPLDMAQPGQVEQLPSVSLRVPLPAPAVTPVGATASESTDSGG